MLVPHIETYVPSFLQVALGVRKRCEYEGELLIGFQNESGLRTGLIGGNCVRNCRSICRKPIKNALTRSERAFVVMSGLEPPTHGFSVRCSTN